MLVGAGIERAKKRAREREDGYFSSHGRLLSVNTTFASDKMKRQNRFVSNRNRSVADYTDFHNKD